MNKFSRFLNALWIYILAGVIVAAFYHQITTKDTPCPLCLLQRLGMISVAFGAALNLRYGIKAQHYGFSLFSAFFGAFVALRQICLHVCPGFPTFGIPVLGLELYTWSFFVFASSIVGCALLLMLKPPFDQVSSEMNFFEKGALGAIFFVVLANTVSTFFECGLTPCQG